MKIDWKRVSKTPGYISLKKAMIFDIKKNWRSKQESYTKFVWVIARATHYAHHLGKPIEEILNEWESKRNYWWVNYYQDSRLPKLNKAPSVRPPSFRSYHKKHPWHMDPVKRKRFNFEAIVRRQKESSKRKDKTARWSIEHKIRMRKYRKYPKNL